MPLCDQVILVKSESARSAAVLHSCGQSYQPVSVIRLKNATQPTVTFADSTAERWVDSSSGGSVGKGITAVTEM